MKKSVSGIGLILLLVLSFGCSEDNGGVDDEFDRGQILENIANNLIVPAYRDFADKTDALVQNMTVFTTQPSTDNLATVKNAWKAATLSWKTAEAFNFGPVDQMTLETSIDLWPTSANGIEESIQNFNGSDTYLQGIGSNRKGLPAIEYLLFHADETQIINEFTDQHRAAYLSLLSHALNDHAGTLLNAWENGYKNTFITNIGNDANASTTLLSNEMIFLLETVKNYKVATPLGLRTLSDPLPDQVESRYAGISLDLIEANLNIIENVFTGQDGRGFDDYLDALNIDDGEGNSLSTTISQQIEKSHQSLEAINDPLENAVLTQQEAVEQLFIDLQELTVLMKNDMMSQLGLLVIFSDNDGD
ncbi:MAG: imelysin family protein [Cyclobacteriaceae bacterium]